MLIRFPGEFLLAVVVLAAPASGQLTWTQSPVNGHWYAKTQPDTWDNAQGLAASFGGNLATVRDSQENDWLHDTLVGAGNGGWIGLYQDTSDPGCTEPGGAWKWISGEPVVFKAWASGEPNNAQSSFGNEDHCGYLGSAPQQWADGHGENGIVGGLIELVSDDCDDNGIPDAYQSAMGLPPQIFSSASLIDTNASFARSAFAADLDGDGDADVLSAHRGSNTIAWYQNLDGQGAFSGITPISTSAAGASEAVADDLDGDGYMDVIAASEGDNKVAWYANDGSGGFGAETVINSSAAGAWAVATGDLDGDGDSDALSASLADNTVAWYENLSASFGPEQVLTSTATSAQSVEAADVDSDGDLDVLFAAFSDDEIAWFQNTDGFGSFAAAQLITSSADGAEDVETGDIDLDGDIDVLSASYNDNKIAWYENTNGLGLFGTENVISTSAICARCVSVGDLDEDGDLDALSASRDDNTIAWYENTGGLGLFGPEDIITTGASGARYVHSADLDGDGDLDVLSASSFDDTIAWFENLPGPFQSSQIVRLGSPPNPSAFVPGVSPPILADVWDPVVDHTSFMPTADVDFVGISPTPINAPSPWGTLLCDPASALLYTAPGPGMPFQIPVPSQCSLVGVTACTQAASLAVIGGQIQLTNAIDITIGTF